MNPDVTENVDDEFARFFRGLGFGVTWDFSRREQSRWYEIYDGNTLLCQVDFGTPLAAFLEDLEPLAAGRPEGTSPREYVVACEDTRKLGLILERVKARTENHP